MSEKTGSAAPRKPRNGHVTWAHAVRDIFVTSINRGQLPVLGMIAVALLMLWKMPADDVSSLASEILHSLQNGELWGYLLFVLTLIGWYSHAKRMRKMFSAEAERIGTEKSRLQEKLVGHNYKSSNKP